ncbi:SWIM zinc finger family protein [Actinoplanes sp. TRM 88003]|uniref:SWIM zinc finger family protein n=1 Tax=Paractinoplanes aksuensis TaxID=2939490 RepID=A0ABT1DQV3_9ACTN|nr:SWIM zinc finger family protein [Actinoplanes aksuensis]MCO8273226.1 SWIM zinc finger family protein [Actinoplanes aksuensis]
MREPDDATCSCLLSPRCLHRAAVLSAAPILTDDSPPPAAADAGLVSPQPDGLARAEPSNLSVGPDSSQTTPPESSDPFVGAVSPQPEGSASFEPVDLSAGRVPPRPGGSASFESSDPIVGPVFSRPAGSVPPESSGPAVDGGGEPASGDAAPAGHADSPDVSTASRAGGRAAASGVSRAQREAAAGLWVVAAEVLTAGISGAGAVAQAELLRVAHQGRVAGLHTAAAAAVRVVEHLRAARREDPAFHRADLASDLRELLITCHRLERGDACAVGVSRRDYQPVGDLRLFGLFCEPIRATTGHAGAITYLADTQARIWAVSDVKPADPSVALTATRASVDLGEVRLSHHDLSRGGLRAVNAHAAASGRLSHGRQRQAITASGATWFDTPLGALWQQPLAAQVDRWLAATAQPPHERSHAHDLAFLDGTILGADRRGLLLALDHPPTNSAGYGSFPASPAAALPSDGSQPSRPVVGSGLTVAVGVPHEDPALAYVGNLRLLAEHAVGQRVRMIGRFAGPGRVEALALAARWLPERYGGHVDLGAQRLTRADVPGGAESPGVPAERPSPPLHLVRHQLERVVAAGRTALLSGVDNDVRRLADAHLGTASAVVAALEAAGVRRTRDVFGRLDPHDAQLLAEAWLTAAAYEQAAAAEATRQAWR